MQDLILLIEKMVALMEARDPKTGSVPVATLRNLADEVERELERLAPVLGKHHHVPKH